MEAYMSVSPTRYDLLIAMHRGEAIVDDALERATAAHYEHEYARALAELQVQPKPRPQLRLIHGGLNVAPESHA
jgi:hypothetical protein